jgi:hypothetical protein
MPAAGQLAGHLQHRFDPFFPTHNPAHAFGPETAEANERF